MKLLIFILLISLSACKQHSKPLVLQENKPVLPEKKDVWSERMYFLYQDTFQNCSDNFVNSFNAGNIDSMRFYIKEQKRLYKLMKIETEK